MTDFYADPAVGGDGSHTTDDNDPGTGLGNGGFWTRLVPMFRNVVAVANFVRARASETAINADTANNAAAIAVTASNSAVAKTTTIDTNPVVQSAGDPTRQVKFDVTTRVPGGTVVTLKVPPASGNIATEQYVTDALGSATVSNAQLARMHATALSF